MITLKNENFTATISPKGAELQSLKNNKAGIEYMWSGDAAYWGKHSPVLFPIVGSLKDDIYFFEDKKYTLPRHGFARDKEFITEQKSDNEASFTLSNTEDTLKVYPFPFKLVLHYKLENNKLNCTYEVYNPSGKNLYFSVGGHPAFAIPMVKNTSYNDYYLQFNEKEKIERWKLSNGLISDIVEEVPIENGKLMLTHSLFYEDALVLKHLQSNTVSLRCTTHQHGLTFGFNGFPFFGIWAAKDAPFVCLEPWCGVADSVHHNQQLTDKEGIISLQPNSDWKKTWSVDCFCPSN